MVCLGKNFTRYHGKHSLETLLRPKFGIWEVKETQGTHGPAIRGLPSFLPFRVLCYYKQTYNKYTWTLIFGFLVIFSESNRERPTDWFFWMQSLGSYFWRSSCSSPFFLPPYTVRNEIACIYFLRATRGLVPLFSVSFEEEFQKWNQRKNTKKHSKQMAPLGGRFINLTNIDY